ncbi:amidohydrolase family protein [Sphingomonas sp. MMS24-J13]|uniref:amidohydrolase family protein n=1 Tax=Sphingomonas sp. MMS24-J13 TaxID=3238686 RepID=UPI003850B1C9
MSTNLESLEIIDAQIHEPWPGKPLDEDMKPQTSLWQVELAREAMDAIGVDIALAVTSEAFIELAHQRYPGRFPGVHTLFHTHPDLASEVRRIRANPAMVAGRALVGDFINARMRPEFAAGVFDPIYATAEEVGLPIFNSTHGGCAHMAAVAERHPNLILIVDHIGVAQHPVSPPETMTWAPFEDLLELAKYPNVHVKLCGAPLLSQENYPYEDVWPNLDRMFAAFGHDRILWGSDYTRLRSADLPKGDRPRRRGITYGENLNYLLHSGHLTYEQKALVLGGNARRLFNLPPASQDWGPPPMSWGFGR